MVLAALVHRCCFLVTKLALFSRAPSAFLVDASACISLAHAGKPFGTIQVSTEVSVWLLHLAHLWLRTCIVRGTALGDAGGILAAKVALLPTKAVALLFDAGLGILLNVSIVAYFGGVVECQCLSQH
ncbi:unnamed protein product [Symbiodinium necroappetens]|uniref:Secreted protein n=1 Tax=Symbiodinium necroappetens TaxID=1628268 RepID=A0A813B1B4_9DINO|nr:unnamed protein product [Symbiodinium necroappetens]